MREITQFTYDENDELLRRIKDHADRSVLSVDPLEPSVERALAVSNGCPPLETAAEAILLNDMFALFLSSSESGQIIAVSGGFRVGNDREYHVVGAGNAGSEGVSRPDDELCARLERACSNFISSNTGPLNPGDKSTSEVLIAALDISHAKVLNRLDTIRINTNPDISPTTNVHALPEQGLQPWRHFYRYMTLLRVCLRLWEVPQSEEERTRVAVLYGQFLKAASEVWDKTKDPGRTSLELHEVYIRGFNSIAKGLHLLRNFPTGTRVVFDWPQGPVNGDRFRIGDYQWANAHLYTNCQLHCEIYLALHILFSNSDVCFHSFLVDEGKRVHIIGCSKPSCLPCWNILLGLSTRQILNHPIYTCRTGNVNGRCYDTWGLTPYAETLPMSLFQAITGSKKADMLESLRRALKHTLHTFRWRWPLFQNNVGYMLGPIAPQWYWNV